MAEYVSKVAGLDDDGLSAAIDILYESVRDSHVRGVTLPNSIVLMKEARENFGIGLKESMDLVRKMECEYRVYLYEIGYFNH